MRTETKVRITKNEFYELGGFSNPKLIRVTRKGSWSYYRLSTN